MGGLRRVGGLRRAVGHRRAVVHRREGLLHVDVLPSRAAGTVLADPVHSPAAPAMAPEPLATTTIIVPSLTVVGRVGRATTTIALTALVKPAMVLAAKSLSGRIVTSAAAAAVVVIMLDGDEYRRQLTATPSFREHDE